jgi:iron complex outermembrane receptor protein
MSPLNLASPLTPRRLKRLPLALLLAGSASWTHGYAAEAETPAPVSDRQNLPPTVRNWKP